MPRHAILVHDWLTGMRGGEKVLESFCRLFERAPIFTLVGNAAAVSETIASHPIKTSYLQRLPNAMKHYRNFLPLYSNAIESLRLPDCDLVLSSSHAVAKGVRPPSNALHISYVHTPMRYVWDMFEAYFAKELVGSSKRAVARAVAASLRRWDVRTASRVHRFIANSENVRERIQRHYNRDAEVIYPPVDTGRFSASSSDEGYYLVLSALVPYKRVDLAIQAATKLDVPLQVVGTGPEEAKLRRLAGDKVSFRGWASDSEIAGYYRGCKGLLFPGEEDFGIVPVEAMASGKPVIAFGKGGALETVIDGTTGVHFAEQTVDSLAAAMETAERTQWDAEQIRRHALAFDTAVFERRISEFISQRWDEWRRGDMKVL
ncbi:MAG: glycosyl transferase family 1 [Ectothiorhodospiraceae bacterium]|nr:glycosyl transferase family 1 [Ectothiorhodospiraceae bacterium]